MYWEGIKDGTVIQEANAEALDKTHFQMFYVLAGIFTLGKFRRNRAINHCAYSSLRSVSVVFKHFFLV